MRPLPALAAALPLVLCAVGCGGGGSTGPSYVEPKATRVDCPAPILASGGVNPAVDPGPVCIGAPRLSALPAAPADATHGWQDLGEHRVDVSSLVEVNVPPGTASLLLVEQLVSGGPPGQVTVVNFPGGLIQVQPNLAVIGELWDPAGRLVYTDLEVTGGGDLSGELLTVLGAGSVVGSVAYPSTSASLEATAVGGVAPGTWRVMVNDYAYECWLAAQPAPPPGLVGFSCDAASQTDDAVYRLFALTTPAATAGGSAIPARGALDVAFHLVDAPTPLIGITAAEASGDLFVRRMVRSLGWLLAGAGVCLGNVTFYDAPDWARERFATTTSASDAVPCGHLSQLLATSRPGGATLDLFLLPFLRGSPGDVGVVIGVDGTIPGPATINGTVASGAVVSAEDLRFGLCPLPSAGPGPPSPLSCGADLVAVVAAHEAGHYLGLFHPSESNGADFDPLVDTPHCECSSACGLSPVACAGGGLPASRCQRADPRCAGAGNLMFWQLSQAMTGYLSPEQARIVRSSPLVRAP
jgi:hypothetical protein